MPDDRHPVGPVEDLVLDIGGDVGALVIYTDGEWSEREIEVSPWEDDLARTHTAVHRRQVGGHAVFAAVYPELRAGTYRIWTADPTAVHRVTVTGGRVAVVDWRRPASPATRRSPGC